MIQAEATRSDINFTYVPDHAFDGHELCASNPYVNRVQLSNSEYSMHPTEQGQQALANAVAAALGG